MTLDQAYENLFNVILLCLAVLIGLGFIRALKGPKVSDRIVAVNMIGTITITIIVAVAAVIDEAYLVDICLIYAMISFLAVIVLTKVYMGAHEELKRHREDKEKDDRVD